jgi:septal ring factor EnvC (AmiA/AmiB activator)
MPERTEEVVTMQLDPATVKLLCDRIDAVKDDSSAKIQELHARMDPLIDFIGENGVGLVSELNEVRKSLDQVTVALNENNKAVTAIWRSQVKYNNRVEMLEDQHDKLDDRVTRLEAWKQTQDDRAATAALRELDAAQQRRSWWQEQVAEIVRTPLTSALTVLLAAALLWLERYPLFSFLKGFLPHK